MYEMTRLQNILSWFRCWKWVVGWVTPFALMSIPIYYSGTDNSQQAKCAFVVLTMAIYWLTEVIPLPVTAIIPIYLFPLLNVLTTKEVAKVYCNETLMIFLGSVMATVGIEQSFLHQRIALKILMLFGTSPIWLLLGFMSATAFLSMWIMNIAATVLMLPTVDAIMEQLMKKRGSVDSTEDINHNGIPIRRVSTVSSFQNGQHKSNKSSPQDNRSRRLSVPDGLSEGNRSRRQSSVSPNTRRLSKPGLDFVDIESNPEEIMSPEEEAQYTELMKLKKTIYLGIAFASGIGGTGTLTGTPPNMIFKGMVSDLDLPTPITYANWMFYAIPPLIVTVILLWMFLCIVYLRSYLFKSKEAKAEEKVKNDAALAIMKAKYDSLGPLTFDQWAVLLLFCLLVCLWFFRDPDFMIGWSKRMYPLDSSIIDDASVAMIIVTIMFLTPAVITEPRYSLPLMDWKTVQENVPWGIFLLIGGSFAMAEGADKSGLSSLIGNTLMENLGSINEVVLMIIVSVLASFVSEVTSFSATSAVFLPIVKDMAIALGISPLKFMLPVCLSCSLAFMFPAGTPSNAIIFETAKFKISDMALPGIFVKFICLAIVIGTINSWAFVIYDLDMKLPNGTEPGVLL